MIVRATTRASLAALLALATGGPLAGQESASVEDALRPGDLVRLSISREADMSGDYPVDEVGRVALPLIGIRDVTGVSPLNLRRDIIEAYEEQLRNQTIQVTLLRRVRVLGQVNDPGLYHADPTMTLGDVVALAGGATSLGKLNDIRIVRGGQRFEIDVNSPVVGQVRSGDQIVVPERSWFSRNAGLLFGAAISTTTAIILSQL